MHREVTLRHKGGRDSVVKALWTHTKEKSDAAKKEEKKNLRVKQKDGGSVAP